MFVQVHFSTQSYIHERKKIATVHMYSIYILYKVVRYKSQLMVLVVLHPDLMPTSTIFSLVKQGISSPVA